MRERGQREYERERRRERGGRERERENVQERAGGSMRERERAG